MWDNTNNFLKVSVKSNNDGVAGLDDSARIVFTLVQTAFKRNARALISHLRFFILFAF